MIRIDKAVPPGVVVAEAVGQVTADDYKEHLVPVLEDVGARVHHWTSFDRMGLVTDHEAYRTLAKALGFLMPGEVRAFPVAELAAARAWITATSTSR